MDLILRNALIVGAENEPPVDIGIEGGRVAAIEAGLAAEGEEIDVGGRLVSPGFIETHIHLDKSCLLDRCKSVEGTLEEAISEVAKAKQSFQPEEVRERAVRTLEKCILQGTTHMRTHLEVDPVVGLRSLEGIQPLIDEYKWAIDLEICVFPQEGLLNNPGTDELMVEGLKRGCHVVGGAPYTDSDPPGQIDRLFEMAREFDVDVDMHLDFGNTPEGMTIEHVCNRTEEVRLRWTRDRRSHDPALDHGGPGARAHHPAPRRRRRGGDGPAVHRSLPDGPAPGPQRAARRGADPQDAATRCQLQSLVEQRAQSLHALRRLLAHPDGQPVREHLPGRPDRRHHRVLRHGDPAIGRAC